jgi:4-amino-4-deoxy-L-arabinose transferase-like glycosyltransferase
MKSALTDAQTSPDRTEQDTRNGTVRLLGTRTRFYIALSIVIFIAAILDFALAATWLKFSRAEVFFAECAREMIATNNFVTPLYHNKPFFDKPILTYWLIILMFKNFGFLHLAARVPSIFAGLASVAFTAMGGFALFNRKVGIIAGAVLATSFMFFAFSALCMSDMLLVLFDCATLTCLYAGFHSTSRRGLFFWLASISMGLAFLTKGPVGVVLPAISFFAFLASTGRLRIIRGRDLYISGATVCLINLPWFSAAFKANGWDALIYFFVHENLQRFTGTAYDAQRPFWYTLVSLFTGFAPWSVFVPFALYGFVRDRNKEKFTGIYNANLFLWIWLGVTIGFYSLSHGKCDYYTLPAFPAAALLVAQYLYGQINRKSRLMRISLIALAAALGMAGVASGVIAHAIVGEAPIRWTLASAVLIASAIAIALQIKQDRWLAALMSGCGAIALAVTAFSLQVLPAVLTSVPINKYAAYITSTPGGTPVVLEKDLYSWADEITFLTGRHPLVPDNNEAFKTALDNHSTCIIIAAKSNWQSLAIPPQSNIHLISEDAAITKPLTPGLALQTGGKMTGDSPIWLMTKSE